MTTQMPLRDALRERFADVRLDPEQMRVLTGRTGEHPRPRRAGRPVVLAAALVLASVTAGWIGGRLYEARVTESLISSIAAEVVENHLKLKPLDVEGDRLTTVLAYFDDLDFQPMSSPKIASDDGDSLLGGRYCSVQGITAAQLRVEHRDGTMSTWYQASLPTESMGRIPDIGAGAQPAESVVRGMRVRIWREKGLLFIEARPAAPAD